MIIISKLTERDYINASFVLLSKKMAVRIIIATVTLGMVGGILSDIMYRGSFKLDQILPLIVFIFVFTTIYYFSIKRAFKSNKRASECIEYQFIEEYLIINGESFTSKLSWDKIYRVTQTKHWIFIWHSRVSANSINKRDIWPEQRDELKQLCAKHRVRNNL